MFSDKPKCNSCTYHADFFDELTQKYCCSNDSCLGQIYSGFRHEYWPLFSHSYKNITGTELTVSKYLSFVEQVEVINKIHGSSTFGSEFFNPLSPLVPKRIRRKLYKLYDDGSEIYVLWSSKRKQVTLINVYSVAEVRAIQNIYSVSPSAKERAKSCPHFYIENSGKQKLKFTCFECKQSLSVSENSERRDGVKSSSSIVLTRHAKKRFYQRFPNLDINSELLTLTRCSKQIIGAIKHSISFDTHKKNVSNQVRYYRSSNDVIFVVDDSENRRVCVTVLYNPLADAVREKNTLGVHLKEIPDTKCLKVFINGIFTHELGFDVSTDKFYVKLIKNGKTARYLTISSWIYEKLKKPLYLMNDPDKVDRLLGVASINRLIHMET